VPGNSQRRGAVRKRAGKAPTAGSGGQRRKGLDGKGPTPKAADRGYHPAHQQAQTGSRSGGPRSGGRTPYAGPSRSRSPRGKRPSEFVAGRNAVVEALRAGVPVTTVYVATRIDADDRVRETLRTAAERGIPILEAARTELDRLTGGAVHQGLAMQVPAFEYADLADLRDPPAPGIPLLVALDGVTDARNLGAVVRSVAAFGGHGVLLPERRSAGMTAGAWKSSAGAAARLPVARVTNLTRALTALQQDGFFVVGLDAEGERSLPALTLADRPLVLVVGSEGKGLSRLVAQTCDELVAIPMAGPVESLNAGVAAGVALYEVARQRAANG
jgi:23S rRNA (guanosine2251-2'-O)-methyltransferase